MSGRRGDVDGLLVVDKPPGPTSHDVVARCRRLFDERRIGHAGTLDPSASGVLCLGLGRTTRLLRFVGEGRKRYEGEVVLGIATTTLDDQGDVTGRWDLSATTRDEIDAAAATLRGEISQVPPMVSARKVGGRRLHALARAGVEVEREARTVVVDELTLEPTDDPSVWRISVLCSAGTYVRSLADDLGRSLGGGAHLRALRRLAVGPFTLGQAWDLAALEGLGGEERRQAVLPPAAAVGELAWIEVAGTLIDAVAHGSVLDPGVLGAAGPGPWAVGRASGELLAVYERVAETRAKPMVVLVGGAGGTGS